ncbi:GNAT family N-acetyltransferase [Deinococcus maricopensis]|uniref:GCN5-related N-acetyltransferase n=1 Tax=Deinococcus maricopensis (strain DSM 21211 / LMG 22137 / NRRL B-23946 / LB-34) TaxID=709986 RepID=E8U8L2_DEIML|nr:GNAT family N-acetyltransferase [Deinococcus maricopensis]ADV67401.1 GCN5-related N-acetyltransferase [Deinococcus maricopensis DSM 21211]
MLTIRPAVPGDARACVPLIVDAIGDIALTLTVEPTVSRAAGALRAFFQEDEEDDNRLSYRNAWVAEVDGHMAGVLVAYDGARARMLDWPFLRRAWALTDNTHYVIEEETEAGEFYVDTVSVRAAYQGRGVGTQLVQFAVALARERGFPRVTLLVDEGNVGARRLYERLGFEVAGTRSIGGHAYWRLSHPLA